MERRWVKFRKGCGLVFDESAQDSGPHRWVEACTYFSAHGVTWDDITLVDEICPPCQRVLTCVGPRAVPPAMEADHRS